MGGLRPNGATGGRFTVGNSGPFGVIGLGRGRHGVTRGSRVGGRRVAGWGLLAGVGLGRATHGSLFKNGCLDAIFQRLLCVGSTFHPQKGVVKSLGIRRDLPLSYRVVTLVGGGEGVGDSTTFCL